MAGCGRGLGLRYLLACCCFRLGQPEEAQDALLCWQSRHERSQLCGVLSLARLLPRGALRLLVGVKLQEIMLELPRLRLACFHSTCKADGKLLRAVFGEVGHGNAGRAGAWAEQARATLRFNACAL